MYKNVSSFRFSVLLLFFWATISCTDQSIGYKDHLDRKVDSFTIRGISFDDLLYLTFLNDSTLYSYSRTAQTLTFYTKQPDSRHFEKVDAKSLKKGNFTTSFFETRKNDEVHFYMTDNEERKTYVYDQDASLVFTQKNTHAFPLMDSAYNLYSTISRKAKLVGDTLYTAIVNQFPAQLDVYYKTPILQAFLLNKDTFAYLKPVFLPPENVGKYDDNMPYFCSDDRRILMVYPCFDTLYRYNLNSGDVEKKRIGNKDYVLSEEFDYNLLSRPDYNQIRVERLLKRFSYEGISINPSTSHTVLFYRRPVPAPKEENKLPVPGIQPLYALVLDSNDRAKDYYLFPTRHYYWVFISSRNGIAIPKYTSDINEETLVQFDVFDL